MKKKKVKVSLKNVKLKPNVTTSLFAELTFGSYATDYDIFEMGIIRKFNALATVSSDDDGSIYVKIRSPYQGRLGYLYAPKDFRRLFEPLVPTRVNRKRKRLLKKGVKSYREM